MSGKRESDLVHRTQQNVWRAGGKFTEHRLRQRIVGKQNTEVLHVRFENYQVDVVRTIV